jgi:hypothetical protein
MSKPLAQWADAMLRRYHPSLERLVGPSWMPLPVFAPDSERHQSYEKYGCGSFGCAFPTADPAVALKITTDSAEAIFASAAIRIASFPPGIVRIFQVAGASGADMHLLYGSPRREDAFFLWRENLAVACQKDDFTPEEQERLERVFRPINALYKAWAPIEALPDVSIHTGGSWARQQRDPDQVARELSAASSSSSKEDQLKRASLEYLLLQRDLAALTPDPLWGPVAEAVLFYAQLGILLFDISIENTGYLHADKRGLPLLYDVGLAKILDPRWLGRTVSEIY